MAIPTVAWNEEIPNSASPIIQGDNRIREMKTQIREIFEEEHIMESGGNGSDWGYHGTLTIMKTTNDSNPAAMSSAMKIFTKWVTDHTAVELFFIDSAGSSQQLTSNGKWIGGMSNEIKMWSGTIAELAAIPGWKLCDGVNATPNLVGKFIKYTATETSGGSDTVTLAISNMPSHDHSLTSAGSSHSHSVYIQNATGTAIRPLWYETIGSGSAFWTVIASESSHSHTLSGSVGAATAINNRPSYYELAFIRRG
jgi:hypothetical protein